MIPGAQLLDRIRPTDAELALLGVPADPRWIGLFEGFGGLTLGVRAALGGTLVAYSEIDPASLKLLGQHFPDVPNVGDVTTVDWTPWRGLVDGVFGGFPCQDVSHAGLGAGIQTGTRSGLWYEFARAIAELRPSIVIIENVRGLRSAPAGIKEWTESEEAEALTDEEAGNVEPDSRDMGVADGGDRPVLRALGAVLGDLAELGYVAEWDSIRAAEVGAPHRRERVFIVAAPANPA